MVRFIEHDPVRAARLRTQLGDFGQEFGHEAGALWWIDGQQIDHNVHNRPAEQTAGLLQARFQFGGADDDSVAQFHIVTLRVHDTELKTACAHLLQERCHDGRLAAAG